MKAIWSIAVATLIATSAAPAQPSSKGATHVPDEVIVKLRDGQGGTIRAFSEDATAAQRHQASLFRLRMRHGLENGVPLDNRAGRGLHYLLKTARDVRAVCAELNRDPEVEYAQPNYIYRLCREPNDPDFADQYAHQLIQMQDAWEISTGSHDIIIAVLDTGVDVNHPDLKDNIWINKGEIPDNGKDDDGNGYIDDIHGWNFGDDDNKITPVAKLSLTANHGTMVAGVIAATGNNGRGVSGVNWHSSIMVLRLSDDFTSKEVAAALDYAAANGARVVFSR
ncbi:MAG: S8 family serine peptidase [Actinobacteria bacterium]|nr:S8 family serine peptidase [Actinomycetota bacterium]